MAGQSLTTAFLLSALISGWIALYTWQHRHSRCNSELAWLMIAATVWSLTSALEWDAHELGTKIFWSVLSYLGSQTCAVFYLLFALRYSQQDDWLTRKRIALFFVFPAIAFGMAATNAWHHLLWPDVILQITANGAIATYLHGPWFWLQIFYAYSLLGWGVALLLRSVVRLPHLYSIQSRFLVLAAIAPLAGNALYAIYPDIFRGADPTPIAFSLTGIFLGWAIFRYQLLNLHPIARERFLTMVNEITSAALKASDTPDLLQILADRMGTVINADGCFITLWDENNQITIPMAASGSLRETYRSSKNSSPEDMTMTKSVLLAGHALVAEDVFNTPYISPQIAAQYPTRSMLGIPLIAGDRKLGAILVSYNSPHTFSPEEIALEEQAAAQVALAVAKNRLLDELRQTMAEQTASAILNARLYEQVQQELSERQHIESALQHRAQELAALYDTSIDINSQLDLPLLLRAIVERAAALTGAHMGSLYLLRPNSQTLELVVSYNLPRDFTGTILQVGEGLSGRVAQTGEPMMISDYSQWEGRASVYADIGLKRVLGVPLKTKGQVLGVIVIEDTLESGEYSQEQIRLVSLFADQASIAVENARLFGELQQANILLEKYATTDKVTGAYNRRKFDDVLAYEIRKAERYHLPLVLVMFDIDLFKQVNDIYGHQAGDQALIELVRLIRDNIRGSDWLVRWGGDEFMILAPGISLEQATILAEKIRKLVEAQRFPSVEHLTVSLGVTQYQAGDTPEAMVQRVDAAMYQAKNNGRNCFAMM